MQVDRPRLVAAATVVTTVATLGSITLSGLPAFGWKAVGLIPCELCWYQRILMYPLPALLGWTLWTRTWRNLPLLVGISGLGVLVAAYHTAVQLWPSLEAGQCSVGYCTIVLYEFLGFTIPQLSLIAFTLATLLLVAALRIAQDAVESEADAGAA